MVSDFSSKCSFIAGLETTESIDANHTQMTECSDRSDARYKKIAGVVKDFVKTGVSGGQTAVDPQVPLAAASDS